MNVQRIIALLKVSAEPDTEATGACLPPERLAAYHDGVLHNGERTAVETHLASCDRCLGQLSAISRAAAGQDAEAGVPASLISRADALFTPAVPSRRSWAVPLAAAAMLLLALNLALGPSDDTNNEPGPTATPQTRYADHEVVQPRLLAPAEGSVVQPSQQVFQWTEVPGTLFYDVRLVSLDGDLLLQERVDGTRWLIPESLHLKPGQEYFVRIDAYLSDAKYLSSEHRVFRVGGVQ